MKMNEMFKTWTLLSTLMATMTPTSVDAGLKYWTTGRYDADSYVQDGLVLNYDGIRNVGIDQPHSMTTTTWVNLANPGTQDLTKGGSGKNSKWLDDGFFFDGNGLFRRGIQILVCDRFRCCGNFRIPDFFIFHFSSPEFVR